MHTQINAIGDMSPAAGDNNEGSLGEEFGCGHDRGQPWVGRDSGGVPDPDLAEAPVPGASGGTSMKNATIIAEGEKCSPVSITIVDTAGVVIGSALRYIG
jgi:hypothetical protein